ncbi:putative oxidoreductase CipA-like protein [Aspergillus steynii IBT 23096]|uniref:Putative oxidoreductase CipA-like protein n=1 Tax=Aspergillus steynii IBT 23096 TaxID=1392250 RepID=A0A2I2GBB0_9EURO|nr:putative oxidoreductase CipA-like protein [Aspergillus steynii IBT 23096]PLB50137.1 putative oxidoreductase CipA-like protein [Aspergillus steynii IBT 23096]
MSVIRNVAIAGASGDLGKVILRALTESNLFEITVLTRHESSAQFAASVRVIRVDFTSVTDLTAALANQDAVVSVLNSDALDTQLPLIDASLAAGVKRFIPSEFSANNGNPKTATLPAYKVKIAVHEIIQRHARENPQFTYTVIRNGPFLDWSLALGFFLTLKPAPGGSGAITTPFYDGGDRPFSTSTLATVGKAVVGVLHRLEKTTNRVVFVHDLVTTQRKMLAIARKIAPEREWNTVHVSTADMEARARENYAQGKVDIPALMGCFCRSVFAEGYGGEFEEVDNQLLGIPGKNDEDLEGLIRDALEKSA